MNITRDEMETVINFDEEGLWANVYTYNKKLKRKLQMYSEEFPSECYLRNTDEFGLGEYMVKKDRLSINLKRPWSDERKNAYADRAKKNVLISNFGRNNADCIPQNQGENDERE